MSSVFTLLIMPESKDYIPANKSLRQLIDYVEKNEIINVKSKAKFPGYAIGFRKSPHPEPKYERKEFKDWITCKKEMLNYLKNGNNIENISFMIEISDEFENIILKYKKYLATDMFGNFCFGVKNPPNEYWYGDAYKKGETNFSIELFFFPGPHNQNAEKKFFKALLNDKDFVKILNDFESLLGTKLKLDSHWSW